MEHVETIPGLVSIMIPTYERPRMFEEALKSALAQTYPHVEIIVCDNSRDERTAELMEKYLPDPRVKYVRNREAKSKEENFMPFERLAHGEYLQWLMDDDVLLPDKLRLMVACFEQIPGITLVTSRRGVIDGEGKYLGQKSTEIEMEGQYAVFEGPDLGKHMLRNFANFVGEPSAALFRRRDLLHHYWKAQSRGYYTISDVAMWLELLEKGDCVVFRDPLSYYRWHGAQEGQQKDVILLSRLEWFRLATEDYPGRRVFLKEWEDFAFLLQALCREYDRVEPHRDPEFLECSHWKEYARTMWKMRRILAEGKGAVTIQDRGICQ